MTIFSTGIKRPNYFDRQQLTADDLNLAQQYHNDRLRQLNRHIHGWGIACGALITGADSASISMSEGFAIAPNGENLFIPDIQDFDLTNTISNACGDAPRDCEDLTPGDGPTEIPEGGVYLVAKPLEIPTDAQPATPAECGHRGNNFRYSRICDNVCIEVVCELPPSHQQTDPNCDDLRALICPEQRSSSDIGGLLTRALFCAEEVADSDNFVVIAQLEIEINEDQDGNPIYVIEDIDYQARNILIPNHILTNYLRCLCSTSEPTQPPPQSMSPTLSITRPGDDPIFEVDPLEYDIYRGREVSIDEMILLNDSQKAALHRLDVDTLTELYIADTPTIAESLGISEVRVIEYKDNALESMRRAETINMDREQFDVDAGMRMSVEEVPNIGRIRGETLTSAGYASVIDVANTNPTNLSRVLSISEETASEMISDAQQRVRFPNG